MNVQKQNGGDNSQNIQVNGNVTCGLSYADARQIALDVFNANCQTMMSEAARVAEIRANKIVDDFIKKLYEEHPDLSYRLQEPSVQYSTFSVIKNYVKTGDEDLKERLLKMLMHRLEVKDRSIEQIVLDESIEILPKLTQDLIDVLSLVFSAIYVRHNIINLDTFNNFINNELMVFYPEQTSNAIYAHLQYTGCCTLLAEGSSYKPFTSIIKNRYSGLFNKGFSKELLEQTLSVNYEQISPIVTICQQNRTLLQFNAMDESVLNLSIDKYNLGHLSNKIKQLHKQTEMSDEEIANYLCNTNSKMKNFMEEWKGKRSCLKTMALTSVGYAIAILNYNIKTNANIPFNGYI